ncbi:MAG: ABC transporter substrate-binding protein [Leucobacter sp.]
MTHRNSVRRPGRRSLLTGGAALIAAGSLLLAGCSSQGDTAAKDGAEPSDDLTKVTLMLNWTPNAHHAGIYYAQENGLYADEGIDLEIVEPGADLGAAAAVAEGTVEFGLAPAESLLPAREAGMDAIAIATLLPVNDSALMGVSESGLTDDPKSLEGKRYGGFGGALETEIISELVTCAGGDPEKVEFVDIGNVDYLAGLQQQRFDAAWVFEGWDALRAQSESDDVVTIPFADHLDCIPNWYTPTVITSEALAESDPDLVRGFLAATSAGYEAVAEDPAAGASALLAGAPELDEQLVTDSVAYYAPLYGTEEGFGQMDPKTWAEFTSFLVQAGMLENEAPVKGAWTNDYLPQD